MGVDGDSMQCVGGFSSGSCNVRIDYELCSLVAIIGIIVPSMLKKLP